MQMIEHRLSTSLQSVQGIAGGEGGISFFDIAENINETSSQLYSDLHRYESFETRKFVSEQMGEYFSIRYQ